MSDPGKEKDANGELVNKGIPEDPEEVQKKKEEREQYKKDLKKERTKVKTALTKAESKIKRLMIEENIGGVEEYLHVMKGMLSQFERLCEKYEDMFEDEREYEEDVDYVIKVEEAYGEVYAQASQWLKSASGEVPKMEDRDLQPSEVKVVQPQVMSSPGQSEVGYISSLSQEMINAINLPKMELFEYDGNPLQYYSFITTFDETVDKVASSGASKLNRLIKYTTGEAHTAIHSCLALGGEEGYDTARAILESRFGDNLAIAQAYIRLLGSTSLVKSAKELRQLADQLADCNIVLKRLGSIQEVESQRFIASVVDRLQPYIKNKWRKLAMYDKRKKDKYPSFSELVEFVTCEADSALDPVYGETGMLKFGRSNNQRQNNGGSSGASGVSGKQRFSDQRQSRVQSTSLASSEGRTVKPCSFCQQSHRLYQCNEFRALKPELKLKHVTECKLCENCLLDNHAVERCFRQSMCGIEGCNQKHSRLLHSSKTQGEIQKSSPSMIGYQVVTGFSQSSARVCVPVVQVKVNNSVKCVAMLDTCSTTTFCSEKLANKLGLKGIPVSYDLTTLESECSHKQTRFIPVMYIEACESSFSLRNVFVIDTIPSSKAQVEVERYSHLSGIDFVNEECEVDILVGQDNAELLIPVEVRKGCSSNEPFAIRTVLGWSLHGSTGVGSNADICGLVQSGKVSYKAVSHFVQSSSVGFETLESKVDRMWSLDQEGLGSLGEALSCEDSAVLDMWNKSVQFVDGHYELPIPWKPDVFVPDNFDVAESRFKSLCSSLRKRGLFERYQCEIQKLLDKGYAESVVIDPYRMSESKFPSSKFQIPCSKIWYLPHHAVISDKKPDKLRVVFDCAAQYHGESLNDKCFQGPDLNNKLIHVLLRFREHEVAVMADVEAMYYQVKVKPEHRDALRFLWMDEEGELVKYRMNAHIFGGVWCACIATYAMRRTIEDQKIEDVFVKDVIKRAFYVDDCLKSVSSSEEAMKVIEDVREVLKKGGFNLTKFVSNKEEVLQAVDEEDRAKEVKEFGEEMMSKALGVKWDVKDDEFKFRVNMQEREVTRKTMLSTIASMYDPLGLVSPCVIRGRMIFQEATRLQLSWDEEVPEYIREEWNGWIRSLEGLKEVSFPRCMNVKPEEGVKYEVHNFSDASQKGFGCCSYLKCIKKNGEVQVCLIYSKARVCPMKHVTIPRLELQAAVMSAQVNQVVCEELDIPISASYFWVDSQIVLAYIKNKKRRLKTYVANRVSMIHSLSREEDWKHVAGKKNPADIISRGADPKELKKGLWKEGPEFLKEEEEELQVETVPEIDEEDEEIKSERIKESRRNVKKAQVMLIQNEENKENKNEREELEERRKTPVEMMAEYCSSWQKMKRMIVWLMKVKSRLKNKDVKRRKETIEVEEMKAAEELIIKEVQRKKYAKEIESLKSENKVAKSSSIRNLLPSLNQQGVLCVGGRLRNAKNIEIETKNPYIMPPEEAVTKLIVKEYHDIAHQGTEWTLSLLRKKYWITKPRRVIKAVRKECVPCKKMFDQPKNQKMADLPEERIEDEDNRPFQYVGIDCFGPFYVNQGRAQVKKYGCVYTCMKMRAIHIEKLNTLETDSFINSFRRFMARRGTPKKVWSDNGTNFVGASPDLIKCMQKLDEEKIRSFGLKKEVEWKFNTPHASHMGGVWERQIRTIRKVLTSLLSKHEDKLTDEVLETLFCEVESMVNSRPLTKLSEEVDDMSTISPNQLLLLNEEIQDMPGKFICQDKYKQRWKYIQYLANQFWKKWVKAYLPELQKRSKWYDPQLEIKIGDVVLLLEENTPRYLWPLGLVVEVKKGRDGLVRTVKVKTRSTILIRPLSKVVKIEGSR